jgi:hypothetical protein
LSLLLCGLLITSEGSGEAADPAQTAMEQGNVLMAAQRYAEARAAFEAVVNTAEASIGYKSLACLRIIDSHLREKHLDAAREACRALSSLPEVPPHHVWEAEQRLRAFERVQAGLPPRDPGNSRVHLPALPEPAVTFHVSPDGNDEHPGTREEPFAGLPRALDAIRALKSGGDLPVGGVMVRMHGGTYPIRTGVVMDESLSGRADAPVVIAAAEGESVRLSGGVPVDGFQPVDDPAILSRLPEESRSKVVMADLKASGISEFGQPAFRGFGAKSTPSVELFVNGKPMTPARWPNEGFVRTGKVLEPGALAEKRGGTFEYAEDRPARWMQARDIWLYGYWYYDWADNAIGVASIDVEKHQIRTAHTSPYGIKEGQSYYAFNLLEEIDQPGEWYLDRAAGRLYFYPPEDLATADVALSMTQEPLLRINGVSQVRVQGLTLELGAGDGIVIDGGEHCLVAGCLLRQFGATGVIIRGGKNHGVLSCDLHTLGRGGTVISGGDRKTLEPGGHFVENCHIHHFSRIDRTYTPAVQIEGVGNRIAHNRFHDTPCHAIRLEGNDHVVEFNEVFEVVRESDDQGGLDMFYNPGYRGNVLRYNYWHDIGSGRACGQAGIRLDDAISGTAIYGNVFQRCSEANFGGVQIHGGKDNWVDNNVFVDCRFAVSFSPWGADRWKKFLASEAVVKLLTEEVDITAAPYRGRYPGLDRLEEGNDINRIWRNVVFNCGGFLTRDQGIQETINNLVTDQDPGFVDAADRDFALKEDATPCAAIGFAPIPFAEIGLYDDSFRDTRNVPE